MAEPLITASASAPRTASAPPVAEQRVLVAVGLAFILGDRGVHDGLRHPAARAGPEDDPAVDQSH
ncbi:hypothetical protein ACWC9T_36665 [Kitasatospora sp. NPDC001159]